MIHTKRTNQRMNKRLRPHVSRRVHHLKPLSRSRSSCLLCRVMPGLRNRGRVLFTNHTNNNSHNPLAQRSVYWLTPHSLHFDVPPSSRMRLSHGEEPTKKHRATDRRASAHHLKNHLRASLSLADLDVVRLRYHASITSTCSP